MNPHNTGGFQWAGVLVYFLSQAQVREGHLEHVAVKRKKMDGGMDGWMEAGLVGGEWVQDGWIARKMDGWICGWRDA